jgi:ABC-2 type transport system ATP-binding protein
VIEVRGLTKRYGTATAVAELTADVVPGTVTAFIGRNGAGKSTTLRLLLGLERPTAGSARIAGRPYAELDRPLRTVGALLDSGAAHPGRTARAHLRWLAASNRLPARRVGEVLAAAGLQEAADRRVRGFSLGMRQRLGVAAALLGDPAVLLLDEPTNGLDPEGIRWLRTTLRALAAEGRTVLVSSHLLGEVARTADRVLVLASGRLVADTTVAGLVGRDGSRLRVRTPQHRRLADLLTAGGAAVERGPDDVLLVAGAGRRRVGEVAARHGVPLLELTDDERSLEDAVLDLTADRP